MSIIFTLSISFILLFCNLSNGQNQEKLSDVELIEKYSQTIIMDSTNTDAYLNLGLVYFRLNMSNDAIKCFNKLMKLNPDDPEPYYYIGLIFNKNKKNEKAIIYFKKVLEKDNLFSDAYYQLGLNYALLSEFNTSIFYTEKYTNLEPQDPFGYELLGRSYMLNSSFRLAVKPLSKLIELEPQNPEYNYMLYLAHKNLGNKENAVVALKRAVALAPQKKTYEGNSYKEELTVYSGNIAIDIDSFYTQIISDICYINFPSVPEDRSDKYNRIYNYRFFDENHLVLYYITITHMGHINEFNKSMKNEPSIRGFLAGWAKQVMKSNKILIEPQILDYSSTHPGIIQCYESDQMSEDEIIKTITNLWIILHPKRKSLIEIYVTRFLVNYEQNSDYVKKFFNSLKIYD